jgi:hypothetical protein
MTASDLPLARVSDEIRALQLAPLRRLGRSSASSRAQFVVSRGASVGALLTLMLACARFALDTESRVWLVLAATSAALAMVAALGQMRPKSAWPYLLLPIAGWAGTSAMAFLEGGLYSESLFWMVSVPLVAVLSLGRKAAIRFALLVSGTVVVLCVIQVKGTLHAPYPVASGHLYLRSMGLAGAALFSGALGWFYEGESKRAEKRLLDVVMHMRVGIVITDRKGFVLVTNRAFRTLFGVAGLPDALVGRQAEAVMLGGAGTPKDPVAYRASVRQIREAGVQASQEVELRDGRIMELDFIPIEGQPTNHMWCYHEVTLRATREREILGKLNSDAVTGVATRMRFEEHLANACSANKPFALLFVDLVTTCWRR